MQATIADLKEQVPLTSFVKHDLKGVLKYIGVEIWTHYLAPPPPLTVTDIVTKRHLP